MEVLYTRPDRIKEAGCKIPQTWADLRDVAIKTNRLGKGIYGFGQPPAVIHGSNKKLRIC